MLKLVLGNNQNRDSEPATKIGIIRINREEEEDRIGKIIVARRGCDPVRVKQEGVEGGTKRCRAGLEYLSGHGC